MAQGTGCGCHRRRWYYTAATEISVKNAQAGKKPRVRWHLCAYWHDLTACTAVTSYCWIHEGYFRELVPGWGDSILFRVRLPCGVCKVHASRRGRSGGGGEASVLLCYVFSPVRLPCTNHKFNSKSLDECITCQERCRSVRLGRICGQWALKKCTFVGTRCRITGPPVYPAIWNLGMRPGSHPETEASLAEVTRVSVNHSSTTLTFRAATPDQSSEQGLSAHTPIFPPIQSPCVRPSRGRLRCPGSDPIKVVARG